MSLLQVQGLVRRFGGFTAVDGVDLEVAAGERLGLIGPNGSGKTTFIHCVGGALACDAGRIVFAGRDITRLPAHARARAGIARTFQIPRPFASMTVAQNVEVPLAHIAHRHGPGHGELAQQAHAVLARLGLEARADAPVGALSQVELRKLELARALAAGPRLLILDEVMAGLSGSEVDEILELVHGLCAQGVTVLMVEHIMRAIMGFSTRVVCLDAGRLIAQGTPAEVVADPVVRRIYLGQ